MPFHFRRRSGKHDICRSAFSASSLASSIFVRCRRCRINHRCIQHLSGGIHNCQLTAGTERRIPAKHHLACDWRLHQKLLQILAKYGDRAVLRLLRQCAADLTLDRRCDQTFIAVCNAALQHRCCIGIILRRSPVSPDTRRISLLRCFDLHGQEFLFFTAVDRQNRGGLPLCSAAPA